MVIFVYSEFMSHIKNITTMKKLNYVLVIGVMASTVIMSACSSGSEQKTQKSESVTPKETAAPDAGANTNEKATQLARGEQIFKAKCIACHQANGQGLPNAFPSLVGSEFLLKQTKLAVSQVLNGSAKVAADRKVKYPAPMPPQVDTKDDAVAVINYVLNNFGNNGGYISLDDVKDIEIMPR
jgi:mono/diheme cytochrome c family protein